MIIALGVDPGLRATGYSVVRGDRGGCALLDLGVLSPAGGDLPAALAAIHEGLTAVLRAHPPDIVAIEDLFAHPAFPRAALLMAHARGVICLAAAEARVPVEALPPAVVKRALVGSGRAAKGQMQAMVGRLLHVAPPLSTHVADAAALAITALSRRGVPLTTRSGRVAAGAAAP